ncbi:FHA domain-containing protein [Saccharothrix syringae]|uniref:FHA domain-containing protein n=1 Tax=Saccharothrix syringae TaxID=103733 RepID=A0A5Q0H0H4_SACSY|nr:FHA domain-containing protein [Saccharothrix syringae]QFZ19737.1 FHA domain-containing protein [Saccharothrix syringae]
MDTESLARDVPFTAPGAVVALALSGRISVNPVEGRSVRFGRNRPDVDLCVGETDPRVSRLHGLLTRRAGRWWVTNTGRLPIRLPRTRWLFRDEDPVPLGDGYTPLFIRGSHDREHLLELYVAGEDGGRPTTRHSSVTQPPRRWRLTPDEHLLLVVLGQRYLLHEANPQPVSRQHAAEILHELQPDAGWGVKRVEHMVADVRARLSAAGVHGLLREEVGEPVGNALNDNLLRELVLSTTLVPPDLALLDPLS